jgi:hypothetical protein
MLRLSAVPPRFRFPPRPVGLSFVASIAASVACILALSLNAGVADAQTNGPNVTVALTGPWPDVPAPKFSLLTTSGQARFDVSYTDRNTCDAFWIQRFEPSGALIYDNSYTHAKAGSNTV